MDDKTRDRLLLAIAKILWIMFDSDKAEEHRVELRELHSAVIDGSEQYEKAYDEKLWQQWYW